MKSDEIKTKWSVDQAHSKIGFNVTHLMAGKIKGEFRTFNANISTIGKNFATAEVIFWVKAASIMTNHVKRDRHLKSSLLLNVKKHKQITFMSNTIGRSAFNGDYDLEGELSMVGVTRDIKLNVHFNGILNDHWGHERAAFTVTGEIRRSEWGLTWNITTESGRLVISDEVTISCEVELSTKDQKELRMQLETADNDYLIL